MDNAIESLEIYFPYIAEEVISYKYISVNELLVRLENGQRMVFDNLEKTIRRIPDKYNPDDDNDYRREFSIRLKKAMRRKGYSQIKLSAETGIQPSLINGYVKGKNIPTFKSADKIAKVLGCSLDDLRFIEFD